MRNYANISAYLIDNQQISALFNLSRFCKGDMSISPNLLSDPSSFRTYHKHKGLILPQISSKGIESKKAQKRN